MKQVFLLLLSSAAFVLISGQTTTSCPKYQCAKQDDPNFLSIEYCGYFNNDTNTVNVRKCSKNYED